MLVRTSSDLADLLATRWSQVCTLLPRLQEARTTWDLGHSIHFESPRGFATTTTDGTVANVRFSTKVLGVPLLRVDAIVRHELGHVIDALVPTMDLDDWARAGGVWLPSTPERRADAIAELVWGDPIYYDEELVQTLDNTGTRPRPEHLGL